MTKEQLKRAKENEERIKNYKRCLLLFQCNEILIKTRLVKTRLITNTGTILLDFDEESELLEVIKTYFKDTIKTLEEELENL